MFYTTEHAASKNDPKQVKQKWKFVIIMKDLLNLDWT